LLLQATGSAQTENVPELHCKWQQHDFTQTTI